MCVGVVVDVCVSDLILAAPSSTHYPGTQESSFTAPGTEQVVVTNTPAGAIGLTTCYDLRFPRVYANLRAAGATLILVPSAFMPSTGRAHWECLLRARAIETQCYVAAAAQFGAHNAKRSSCVMPARCFISTFPLIVAHRPRNASAFSSLCLLGRLRQLILFTRFALSGCLTWCPCYTIMCMYLAVSMAAGMATRSSWTLGVRWSPHSVAMRKALQVRARSIRHSCSLPVSVSVLTALSHTYSLWRDIIFELFLFYRTEF
jgi:hypothetical protein